MRQQLDKAERRRELAAFLFLTFVLWPVFTIGLVAAYGFAVWFSQWFFGPPGPLS